MYEKLSEIDIRKEKVNKLKDKIREEIATYRKRYGEELNPNMDNDYPEFAEDYKTSVLEMTALYALEEFINEDYSFMCWEVQDSEIDRIVYTVPMDMIECMSRDDFNFIFQLFFNLGDNLRNYYMVGEFMNDRYFAYDFVSVIDKVLYDEAKKKEKKGEEE